MTGCRLHILVEHYSKSANLSMRSPIQKLKAIATSVLKRDRLNIICLCDHR
ncbi:hypothetical protein [Pseudanabaena sp. SR411]|uniref:hypothetical protein n=1 Tax=Pseudanabaena sp. SR411 TaxID=1980935 RepID=UPI001595D5B8|nr:hypothetical protein [Pseudanabaena sp. SR411]